MFSQPPKQHTVRNQPSKVQCSPANPSTMRLLLLLGLFSAAVLSQATGNPVARAKDVQVQESFEEGKLYGKWYNIVFGSTCRWIKQYKGRFNMGTLVVGPGKTSEEISFATTRLRQGVCSTVTEDYQKTNLPGKFTFHNSKWKADIERYVVRTDYEEHAILATKKNSSHGLSISAHLYGRSPSLREDLVAEFRQLALDLGISEDSIFSLQNQGECVPPEPENAPQRARRTAIFNDEGSADGPLQPLGGNSEADCQQAKDAGPCLGMEVRYFYNTTSKTCETFFYGGCLGSRNNFRSERACLQTCRTEAACRLPVLPGAPCNTEFWAFDAAQGKCVTFKGCGGNANKFYLEKECKEYCGVLPDGEDEFLRLLPAA
uniref:Protein AMBP n=1 Tax=Salvator merianae TaxID=96440 RepID=A0A8D0B7Y3_SALMN